MTQPTPSSADSTPNWSSGARRLWDDYTRRLRECLSADDADPDEVIADLRAHLLEAQHAQGLALLSQQEMQALLQRFGLPDIPVTLPPVDPAPHAPRKPKFAFFRRHAPLFAWAFLVVLPLLTLLNEFLFHDASLIYHNLFPSPALKLLALLVPLHKIHHLLRTRRHPDLPPGTREQLLNGLATTIALWFAILLIPISFLGFLAALFFFWTGFGLLGLFPLSPLLCALHGLRLQIRWNRNHPPAPRLLPRQPPFLTGLLAALLLLTLAYLPTLRQEQLLARAIEGSPAERLDTIPKLRNAFSDTALWHRLFGAASHKNPLPFAGPERYFAPNQRPALFYQITGRDPADFSTRQIGLVFAGLGFGPRWDWDFWDAHLGEQTVGRPNPDLRVNAWRMDASVHADGLLAYTEWTTVFQNNHPRANAEARCLIQVPPGAVVSRVTLWINNEPREAAFGTTRQTTQAYQSVVQRNRDPLLVTQQGLNQYMVQCFPILPEQEMKIRIGITSPLSPDTDGTVRYQPPRLVHSNLADPDTLPPVDLWIESTAPMTHNGNPVPLHQTGGKSIASLQLQLPVFHLGHRQHHPRLTLSNDLPLSYATSPRLPDGHAIVQHPVPAAPPPPGLVLVLDTSAAMAPHRDHLLQALRDPPSTLQSVVLAGFPPQILTPAEARRALRNTPFRSGPPQAPALELALREAARLGLDDILWIHAPSPHNSEHRETLLQYAERRPDLPLIHACSVTPHPSQLSTILQAPFRISETGDAEFPNPGTLNALLAGEGLRPPWNVRRTLTADIPPNAVQTSDHLVRLWARDHILDTMHRGTQARHAAEALGVQHQLVTPVTGAVVLETAAQYKANDLEPADPDTVPGIPEPGTVLLALVLLAVIFWLRHRTPRPCTP